MASPYYLFAFAQLQPAHDPRHIAAYVQLEHNTLDSLSADRLRDEAAIAALCVTDGGKDAAEALARSYGL